MQKEIKKLKLRILELSYKHDLSHIGSCLTALPIIYDIYQQKKEDEKFVLSAGHAHLAHLIVMEHYGQVNTEQMLSLYGIHCDTRAGCDVSTGSLGHGLPIALGMALADRTKNVYCLISDGECAEGSIYEALNVQASRQVFNLKVFVNANGYSAYSSLKTPQFPNLWKVVKTSIDEFPFLQGLEGHYHVMTKQDYEHAKSLC